MKDKKKNIKTINKKRMSEREIHKVNKEREGESGKNTEKCSNYCFQCCNCFQLQRTWEILCILNV